MLRLVINCVTLTNLKTNREIETLVKCSKEGYHDFLSSIYGTPY